MNKLRISIGLSALVLAATLSAFTTRSASYDDPMLWFDPHSGYMFQFFGTVDEAMDDMGAESAGSIAISVGYLYSRSSLPPIGNPFAVIMYAGGSGHPSYGSELKLNIYGDPTHIPDDIIFVE